MSARSLLRRLMQWLVSLVTRLCGQLQHPSVPPKVRSILVIRLDLLGDVLHTMPAVAGLRSAYPDARITMLTLPYTAPLARLFDQVDEVVELDTNRIRSPRGLLDPRTWRLYWDAYRRVRGLKPDLCISVCGKTASLCGLVSGASRRIGYESEAYAGTLTEALAGGRFQQAILEVDYVNDLARAAGASHIPDRLVPAIPEVASGNMVVELQRLGIGVHDRLVVIHAGSTNGSAKRWPAPRWGEFAARMSTAGAKVVLVGAGSDAELADIVVQTSGGVARSLVGRTGIGELLAILDRADLVVGGDSGPLHLAVALGRPVLALYGPTDVRVHGPSHPVAPTRIERLDLPCSPCYSLAAMADCPLGDPICMRQIPVDQVSAAALEVLAQGRILHGTLANR
ncbi:MAG: glycosyltransferase family 9 protein [Chloroflexota bacterium]